MARRPKDESRVSLFPFMSILACLIGILTLMISVMMQIQEMDRKGKTQEEMDRAIANRDLKKTAEKLTQEIEQLKKRIETERQSVAEIAKLEERKIVLKMKLEEIAKARDNSETDAELQKRAENMKLEIVALQRERPALNNRLAELQAQLKERKEAPKPEQSVVVRPGGIGSRLAKNLFFVECNSTGIVLMEPDKEPQSISTAAIGKNDSYNTFLDQVKKTRDSMVLYLVRKSGNEAYRWAAGWAESKYEVTTGKLPIPNDGKIDLSLFSN